MSNIKDFTIHSVTKDDYPELEGKIIDYSPDEGVTKVKAVVVGLNRSVGISIVKLDNKEHFCLCYRGPVSPRPSRIGKAHTYDEIFDKVVQLVEEGYISGSDLYIYEHGETSPFGCCPDGSMCAFSQ